MILYANIGSPFDLGIVFVLALLIFGPKRLPEVGRQVGMALRELRRLSNEFVGVMTGIRDEASGMGQSLRGTFSDPDPIRGGGEEGPTSGPIDQPEGAPGAPQTRRRGLSLSALPPEKAEAEEQKK